MKIYYLISENAKRSICKKSPCLAGQCIPDNSSNGYRCECPSTRTGSLCQFGK